MIVAGDPAPTWIPEANAVARLAADVMGGIPGSGLNEVLFNRPFTAHILGGAPISAEAADGVLDGRAEQDEEQEVEEQRQEAAVQEHRGEDGRPGRRLGLGPAKADPRRGLADHEALGESFAPAHRDIAMVT